MNFHLSKEAVEAMSNLSDEHYDNLKKIVEMFPLSAIPNAATETVDKEENRMKKASVKEVAVQVAKELVLEEDQKTERRKAEALKRRELVSLSKKKEEDELLLLEYEDRVVFNKGFEKNTKVVGNKKWESTDEKQFEVKGGEKGGEVVKSKTNGKVLDDHRDMFKRGEKKKEQVGDEVGKENKRRVDEGLKMVEDSSAKDEQVIKNGKQRKSLNKYRDMFEKVWENDDTIDDKVKKDEREYSDGKRDESVDEKQRKKIYDIRKEVEKITSAPGLDIVGRTDKNAYGSEVAQRKLCVDDNQNMVEKGRAMVRKVVKNDKRKGHRKVSESGGNYDNFDI